MPSKIKPNTLWTASNSLKFVVNSVETKNKETWVFYEKKDKSQSYSCLEPAFLQRFTQCPNES